jgi:AbrB family looped-hinge helix DNA binding protein
VSTVGSDPRRDIWAGAATGPPGEADFSHAGVSRCRAIMVGFYKAGLFDHFLFFKFGGFHPNMPIQGMGTPSVSETVRFTTKGRVVIPHRLRKQFHIDKGTRAIVTATPEGILLRPVTRWSIERVFGRLKRRPGGKPFAEEWAEHKRAERELEDR